MSRTALLLGLLVTSSLLCDAVPWHKPCPLMVKVLDALSGVPAAGLKVQLHRHTDDTWNQIGDGETDITGQVHRLIEDSNFVPGLYKAVFQTRAYWKSRNQEAFHEAAEVIFTAHSQGYHHYTLALLLSPYSYSSTGVVTKSPEEPVE